ncbi:MAG: ATP-dependent DNA ligase [Candidatus Dojkabacteria bacterium]|nr:MAG: ATP-dependent DNA ligase [Candidatus Dojkabacteria bacterium]
MNFHELCKALDSLEKTSARNEMISSLADFLRLLSPNEIANTIYLMQGRVAPLFSTSEFQLSVKSVLKVMVSVNSNAEDYYKQMGDLGMVAALVCADNKPANLTINQVFENLFNLTGISGNRSQEKKRNLLLDLFAKLGSLEAKYVARIIIGKMRLGLSDKSILDSFSVAINQDKSLRPILERAFGVIADLGYVGEVLFAKGITSLQELKPVAGIPVAVKLVEREKGTAEIFARLGPHIIQPKFDGLRAQLHFSRNASNKSKPEQETLFEDKTQSQTWIFSRKLESLTDMFPDITAALNALNVESIIIDSEAIAYDPASGEMLPFQETMRRKRKHDVSKIASEIPVRAHCFDILMLNGESKLDTPLTERLSLLEKILQSSAQEVLVMAESNSVESANQAEEIYSKYVEQKLEGVICKNKDSLYDPGTRNFDWIKLKASASAGISDTIDTVVLGYYFGKGSRAKFGIGALLIGVYDPDSDKFVSVSKLGTGFTDTDFLAIKKRLDQIVVQTIPVNVAIDKNLMPDVLVSPEVITVVEADSVSKSKLHGGESGGYSLRFPRLKVFDRKDKSSKEVTTTLELGTLAGL